MKCINAKKIVIIHQPNRRVDQLKKRYPRLRRLYFSYEGTSEKNQPIHIVLGSGDFQRIRSAEHRIVRDNPDTDPGAGLTMIG